MAKTIKKVGGWLLAGWMALNTVVSQLDKLKGIHGYVDYLRSHWYSAFIFLPRPVLLSLSLLVVGVGLIFSGQLSSYVSSRWSRPPNLKGNQILNCAILWDQPKGCYVRQADPPRSVFGILLEIANQVEHKKPSPTAGRVKAQAVFHFKNGQDLLASPSAWIDEPTSSVELAPGDTRCLIVATGFHFTQDWKVPLNRRSGILNPVSFEHYDLPGLLGNEGTVDIQLISLDNNKILVTFTLGWRWRPQYPLEITHFIQVKH
jgi:hypothetical protein